MSLNPDRERCARCGQVAEGYAMIGDDRYCHGDYDDPTCYVLALWELPTTATIKLASGEERGIREFIRCLPNEGKAL